MPIQFGQSHDEEPLIAVPAIGVDLFVRVLKATTDGALNVIGTIAAPGFGPFYRHPETEIFRVLEGESLYEVNAKRFQAMPQVEYRLTIPRRHQPSSLGDVGLRNAPISARLRTSLPRW